MHVLVVDDQRSARRNLTSILAAHRDVRFVEAASLDEARRALQTQAFDLALVDLRLSDDARDRSGLTLIREIAEGTGCTGVCVTASADMETIRAAMRTGAYDYLLKDAVCEETVGQLLDAVRERARLEREVAELRARVAPPTSSSAILGDSPAIERLRERVRRVALSDAPALILGPTGSGKELVAQAIHRLGHRPGAEFLAINCSAIPATLIESQLFGHTRGAFTGADRNREGYFAAVGEGTLFLDEVGELPLELQPKLLRVLESRDFTPMGSHTARRFEGRVVAATHADLPAMVARREFREDLFYRLQVLTLRVPSLGERREDIPALVAHFASRVRRPLRFSESALGVMAAANWPGNVRELRTIVERVAVYSDEEDVSADAVREAMETAGNDLDGLVRQHVHALLHLPIPKGRMEKIQRAIILEALALEDGNKSAAGRRLDVHRKFIERRVDARWKLGDDD